MMQTIDSSGYLRLLWEDPSTGEPVEQVHPLPVTIGRSRDNSIALNSNRVSRRHVQFAARDGQIYVQDLGSTNGTYVNDTRIQEIAVDDGDIVRVGSFSLTVDVHPFHDSQQPSALVLSWVEPETGESRHVPLAPPLTIGRESDNDVVLPTGRVSRRHAIIREEAGQIMLIDQESTNGTFVNGQRQTRALLQSGDTIQLGGYELQVGQMDPVAAAQAEQNALVDADRSQATLVFSESDELMPAAQAPVAPPDFPPGSFVKPVVSIQDVRASGLPVEETTYLAVGGGVGSFVWVDHLRIYGAKPEQITVIGLERKPYGRYERLCQNSQIPAHERLRSDSGSTPDCIWGWPGYAVREVWGSLKRFELGNVARSSWQIFGEPTFVATYTPRSGDVFAAVDREAKRIAWDQMYRLGHVKAIRKTDDGRYVVAYTQTGRQGRQRKLILAKYVHVAVGYPGVRFLPDLQKYREETGDFERVVNAYEEHEHVYQHLRKHGGVIMVRGRGIVASRIIQRLYEVRQENSNVALLLLLRSPLAAGNRYGRAQRPVEHHWEYQPFNWPKACWGGELRVVLEEADDEKRDQLLNDWGGTTTADRKDWQQILRDGLREGWYQIRFGSVRKVELNDEGKLVTVIRAKGGLLDEETQLLADFIVDCTGLQASLDFNPLLKDLVEHHELARNPKGRLRVANDFELEGMRNGDGRMYASGAMTLGGPYAAVDSFLGLQYAALRSVDALTAAGAPGIKNLNPLRSTGQWLRWARGVRP